MKILYSVQRYGEEIVGGSETACKLFAEQLVARGHEVDVLTSCALNYDDWADYYSPGVIEINGVRVIRLPVTQTRDAQHFSQLHEEIMSDVQHATFSEQHEWLFAMGPILDGQTRWLRANAENYDVVIFMTYLYPTTVFGLAATVGLVPTILQPTAHDEPPAYLSVYRTLFQMPDAFLFLTEEEKVLVRRIYNIDPVGEVVGIGMPIEQVATSGESFREAHGLGDDPYLLYVGRIDVFKGVSELIRYFTEFKGHRPSNMRLVIAGEKMMEIPVHEDVVCVGFLDDEMKQSAIAGSIALVQSSPFESFSIVLCEAWLQSKPVLVQGWSEVMVGQVRRSEGGLFYNGFAEFEGCLQLLHTQPDLASELGQNGNNYVRRMYEWSSVLDKIESTIEIAKQEFAARYNHI
jgi:glycosyltransferase involved in cell wall biosynthesis